MRFSTVIASFLAASAAIASPIANNPATRGLCDSNCFIGQEVQNAENLIASVKGYVLIAASIAIDGPVQKTVDTLNSAASTVTTLQGEIQADVTTLGATLAAELAEQVKAAISGVVSDINNALATIKGAASDVENAAGAVTSAVVSLEAYLTACIN